MSEIYCDHCFATFTST